MCGSVALMASSSANSSDFSPEQKRKIRQLREALSDVSEEVPEDNDYYYQRWLIARKYNVSKAEKMLRNHIQFRKDYDVDTVLQWKPPEVLEKCFSGGFFGEDRDGDPVWYDNFGNLDFKGLYYSCRHEDVTRLKIFHMELTTKVLRETTEKKGHRVHQLTSVLDVKNISYQRHYHWPSIQRFRGLLTLYADNYPDQSKRIIFVNAPQIFPVAYNLLKPFIDEETRKKIIVLGNDLTQVQKYISPDQLPEAYGGTRCEPDPYCTKYINPGCDVPKEYYLSNLMESSKEEMERVVVGRGSSHLVMHHVDTPGTVLRWEFISTNHDVGFGLYMKSEETNSKVDIVAMARCESNVIPESGHHVCDTAGTYVLKFDNSYSLIRSKEVFYSVKVMPPDTDICSSQNTTPTQTEATPLNPENSTSEDDLRTNKPEPETGLTTGDQEAPQAL